MDDGSVAVRQFDDVLVDSSQVSEKFRKADSL